MPMGTLLGIVEGPGTVTVDGVDRSFSNIQECKSALGDRYIVRGIHGAKLELEKAG